MYKYTTFKNGIKKEHDSVVTLVRLYTDSFYVIRNDVQAVHIIDDLSDIHLKDREQKNYETLIELVTSRRLTTDYCLVHEHQGVICTNIYEKLRLFGSIKASVCGEEIVIEYVHD